MKRVIIESPYAGRGNDEAERFNDLLDNERYARRCMADALSRGEAPFASHLLYTQEGILDDEIPEERALGIEAGLIWGECADRVCVYVDRGISKGMIKGVERAINEGREIVFRSLVSGEDYTIDEMTQVIGHAMSDVMARLADGIGKMIEAIEEKYTGDQ